MEGRVGMLFYRFTIIQVNNPEQLAKSTQKLENMIECVKYLIGFEFKSPKILGPHTGRFSVFVGIKICNF